MQEVWLALISGFITVATMTFSYLRWRDGQKYDDLKQLLEDVVVERGNLHVSLVKAEGEREGLRVTLVDMQAKHDQCHASMRKMELELVDLRARIDVLTRSNVTVVQPVTAG